MLLLLTITQNCFIWRHCRIRIDTYQVLIMNIHSPFLMTPANTKQVNMKARESETTGGPGLHLCQLSYSLDTYQRMWNVGCTHTAEHRLTSLFPKSACSHPLCFLEMSRVVCVCMHSQQILCWFHRCSTAASPGEWKLCPSRSFTGNALCSESRL